MTQQQERLVDQIQLFAAALEAFGDAVAGVGRAFRRFALIYSHQRGLLMYRSNPKERRRLLRDWQRFNRRPALIHNGRKPR